MSTDRDSIRIVGKRSNGPAYKTNQPFATSWYQPVVYVLEDGQEVASTYGACGTKRAAVSVLDRPVGNMHACFRDGQYVGTRTTFRIGR